MISKRAIKSLPTKIQSFYDDHRERLVELAVYPDKRRYSNEAEAPRHYVDIERLPGETIPTSYEEAVDHYGWDTMTHAGYVPWHVQNVYGQLVEAFRKQQYPRILFKSGTLSHYLADAHVPLHTTENYDGQLTGDTGVHSRFESDLIEYFPDVIEPRYRPAEYVSNVDQRMIEIVRASHELVPRVLEGDRENQYDNRRRDGYSMVLARETHGEMASRRLNASAHMTASLWYSAWVEAGRTRLPEADFSTYVDRIQSENRSLTYYRGQWSGMSSWAGFQWRRHLKEIKSLFRHRAGVKLATIEISGGPGSHGHVSFDVLESKARMGQTQLEAELTSILRPMTVNVDLEGE